MEEVKNFIRPLLKTKTASTFYQDGKLTPAEFVAAGDLLQRQAPIWKWASGEEKYHLDFLPSDKQFLIAKNIPCRARANAHLSGTVRVNAPTPAEDDFGFAAVEKTVAPKDTPVPTSSDSAEEEDSDSDIVDADEDGPSITEEADQSVAKPKQASNTRIYEASITYDKYYSSPRFWLRGVDADGKALTQQQIFEDISDEHARKTVTMETHHQLGVPFASIHPCKHAHTMKMMMEMARGGAKGKGKDDEEGEPIPVDQYFVFFLKFIATICPTMDIDFTSAARL